MGATARRRTNPRLPLATSGSSSKSRSKSGSKSRNRNRNNRAASLFFLPILLASFACSLLPVAMGYTQLSDDSLRRIPSAGADFDLSDASAGLLAPILVPRVPGTEGSRAVQEHFARFFRESLPSWKVTWHNTTAKTPATGARDVPFSNMIVRRDPPWAAEGDVSRLTLVAHYDSLYKPEGFIGAIDSGAPCAMLLHAARALDVALTAKWEAMKASGEAGNGLEEERGVQILLLDGEEAWVEWSATDSLYGARALAEEWESAPHVALSTFSSPLRSISLFVLLDLLGSAGPAVPSYFQTTHWAYQHMASIEQRMRDLQLLESTPVTNFLPESDKAPNRFARGYVQDDHVPFMVRGVDILHIIPTPFPHVWHTMDDNGAHLDMPTVQDWAKIVTAFAAEWMDLDSFLPALPASQKQKAQQNAPRDRADSRQLKTEL